MLGFRRLSAAGRLLSLLGGVVISLFPSPLRAQLVAREAFASFPADTLQFACTDLAQLRNLPNYPEIRLRLFGRQLRAFEDFLRSMGTNPEKDVDEVALGWRGESMDSAGYFGLAMGRFQPDKFAQAFARAQLFSREYAGQPLHAFGSGEDPNDIFFTFLNGSTAAFGRLRDLKTVLDVRNGDRLALDSSSIFMAWESELEGSAPQWGIATGKAAANAAMPWLAPGGKPLLDSAAFLSFVQAVLYRVEWSSGFTVNLSVVSPNAQAATDLYRLLKFFQAANLAGNAPGAASFVRDMEAQVEGSRLELRSSGPAAALQQVLRGPETSSSQ
jgi:hypothetical protein